MRRFIRLQSNMPSRPRLFVKKRGTRRTGSRWAGKVAEGLLFAVLLGLGAYGLYWLIDHIRTTEDAGWWPRFAMVIPTALIIFGTVELFRLLWHSSASTERRAAVVRKATDWELPGVDDRPSRPTLPAVPAIDAVTDSPGIRLAYRLPIDASSGWLLFTMAAVCIVFFIAVFVVQVGTMHREGQPIWLLTWLMVPFVMAGVWTLFALGRQVLLSIAVGTTRVEVSQHPFYPGGTFCGFVSQTGRLHVRWLQVLLLCEEQAVYQQGTDTRRASGQVHRTTLFSQRKFDIRPQQAFEVGFDINIPADAMHSFVSAHNAIVWTLVVRGRMARWGDFERRFPVYVYPLRINAPASDRRESALTIK
jgi:hypothetical protein